jgi:hypothetical protein
MSNIIYSDRRGGAALGISGSVTLRFKTDQVTVGKKTATIQCDPTFVEIDWDDGTVERVKGSTLTHTYAVAGTYDVKVSTIGPTKFTPRYGSEQGENPASTPLEGGRELIGLLNGSTWRTSPNFGGTFSATNLALIDSSCQQAFDKVVVASGAFAYTPLTSLYSGFNFPLAWNLAGMFKSGAITTWPSTAKMESAISVRLMFQYTNLTGIPFTDFGAVSGASGLSHILFLRDCPIADGGIPNGFRITDGANGAWNWASGWLCTNLPHVAFPSSMYSMWSSYSSLPNVVTIPKEAIDFRLSTDPLEFNFGAFGNCPNLTTIDFSWCPTLTSGTINGWSRTIRNLTLPAVLPLLDRWGWDGISELSASSQEQILTRIDANNVSTGDFRYVKFTNDVANAPPWNLFSGPPTPGETILTYTGAPGQADPIQTWSGAAVTAKNNLVSRGYRVGYYST